MQWFRQRFAHILHPPQPVCLPANGRSSSMIELAAPGLPDGVVELRLRGAGSFAPDAVVLKAMVLVADGRAAVWVYAPRRPGAATLTGPGLRQRVQFTACTTWQALAWDWLPTLVWALALSLFLRGYAFANTYVLSVSMQPTLYENDLLILDKLSYKLLGHAPERGDVFVLRPPSEGRRLIKRVIGLPGETLAIRSGQVYIDGQALREPYLREPPLRDFGPYRIPPGSYFVMGDNRNHSADSRVFGAVPREDLEGRAVVLYWPPNHAKVLSHPASP